MKNSILLFLLLSFSFTQGQENKIILEDLYGTWTVDYTSKDDNFDITVYKRCSASSKTIIHRFYTNGNFEILYNYQLTRNRGPRRCGNENVNSRPKNVKGTYIFDKEYQQVQFRSQQYKSTWDLIWVDKNSFAIKKIRPKQSKT